MAQFVWINEARPMIVVAADEQEAYRKVIAFRVSRCGQDLEQAVAWFAKSDRIEPLGPALDVAPYEGHIPEPRP